MDIKYLRECYESICIFNPSQFSISNIEILESDDEICKILFDKFNFQFTQIDSNLYMSIQNDNYHIIKVNEDKSFNYSMFTRIERHDDSFTFVKNK
jgi:hypothetical protein